MTRQSVQWQHRFFYNWLPYWRLDWPMHRPATSVAALWRIGDVPSKDSTAPWFVHRLAAQIAGESAGGMSSPGRSGDPPTRIA